MQELTPETLELLQAARQAAKAAYNPYSKFSVGAALRTQSGKIYTGCNIENASYSVTLCAERVAGSQAILFGDMDWESLVVVSPQRVSLCGVCRQFCFEFAPELQIWTAFLEDENSALVQAGDQAIEIPTADFRSRDILGPAKLSELLPAGMTLARNS